ncbi:MAG TPA: flagellar filament capping protein FliD [Anaerolineae bacterium]|nr:flagellar filament capping protein FliD [Anaerolineae bacterium]
MASIGGVSGSASLYSASGIEKLIQQTMSTERQPLTRLQTKKDDLKVKKAIYNDIKEKLEKLRSSVQELTGDSGILNKYAASYSDEDVLGVSVSSINSNIKAAKYNVTVGQLAQAHRMASTQQADNTSSLNLSGDLTLNGQTITIDSGDSLNDIRDKINSIDFAGAEVEAIEATIVDNRLVLSSANTGTDAIMTITDSTNGGDGLGLAQIQEAKNAELTVNGLDITRQSNDNLTDIVTGLTFNLKEAGTTQVTIAKDDSDLVDKVKTILEDLNGLTSHLKLKTEPQLDDTATGTNPTYTPAPLGRDFNMRTLRFNLSSDLLSAYTSAQSGAPRILSEIGITVGSDNISFELSDQDALTSAVSDNFEQVADLLNFTLGKVESRADSYLDGDTGIIENSQDSIDDQIDLLDTQIDSYKTRLTKREEVLRKQFYEMQSQLINMQYDFQATQAAIFGSSSIFNQQG